MRIAEIMKISGNEANRLSAVQLEEIVKTLASTVNRMVSNIKYSEFKTTAAVKSLNRSGGRLSSRVLDSESKSTGVVKDRNKLLKELLRGQKYYQSATSGVMGARKLKKEVESRIGVKFKNVTQYNDFWESYNQLKELNPDTNGFDSTQAQNLVASQFKRGPITTDDIYDMIDQMKANYEEIQLKAFEDERESGFYGSKNKLIIEREDIPY